MDEIRQTHETYDGDREAFIEKYLSESGLVEYGDAFVDALDGGRILDLGCGPGVDTTVLVEDGFDVVGFDITRPFLDAASDRLADVTGAQTGQSSFVRGDMRTLPFESDSFDGIWASGSFHHVPREQAGPTVADCRRILQSDGTLFLSAKRQATINETGERYFEYYEVEEFCSLIEDAGFEVDTVDTTEYWVSVVAST